MHDRKRMVVGISGATGVIYGIRLLQTLRRLDIETHLVVSKAGQLTCTDEIGLSADDLRRQADFSYTVTDIGAVISSGSFRSVGMVIAPCSIHTLSEIATGVTSNLLTRAADVVLKDRRRLVLLVGEFPLHTGHLKSMLAVAEIGAVVAPPLPAFYTHPQTVNDLVDQTVGRVLDLFDLDSGAFPRWGEDVSLRETVRTYTRLHRDKSTTGSRAIGKT